MTQEEYIMNKLLQLEKENEELKIKISQLENDKTVQFVFLDKTTTSSYKVNFNNGNVEVKKEN